MTRSRSPQTPRLSTINLVDLADGDSTLLEAHEHYDLLRFTSADLSDCDLVGATFSECEFLALTAHGTDFRSAGFVDTRFDRLDAPVFKAPRSHFRSVDIQESRLGSAEFYEARWQSVHIRDSKLGFINLRGATLRDVLFTNCNIEELDLGGAKANRVSFTNTTVNNLDLSQATLQHVDLRGLAIERISDFQGLRGATMSSFQVSELAPQFAHHFGILVHG